MSNAAKLENLQQIARRFALPAKWLKVEASQGRIPVLRIGRRLLFNPDAVEEALAERAAIRSEAVADAH